jgi:hypothetical protein
MSLKLIFKHEKLDAVKFHDEFRKSISNGKHK